MLIYLDTETTGAGPTDKLCQLAFKTDQGQIENELFNPGRKISIEAMAVHHITNEMVASKPVFQGSDTYSKLEKLIAGQNIIVAHNAEFDIAMLKREGLNPDNFICTLKLSRFLDPNGVIPQYNLQYLRYYLGLNVTATAHDALGDILVLECLFKRIFVKFQQNGTDDILSEMIRVSNAPVLIARMPFGKHKGTLFDDIPVDYLEWLSRTNLEGDMAYTVDHYLRIQRD